MGESNSKFVNEQNKYEVWTVQEGNDAKLTMLEYTKYRPGWRCCEICIHLSRVHIASVQYLTDDLAYSKCKFANTIPFKLAKKDRYIQCEGPICEEFGENSKHILWSINKVLARGYTICLDSYDIPLFKRNETSNTK